jgi:heme/copper-type cytochrome/quinol oxidase subunit 2
MTNAAREAEQGAGRLRHSSWFKNGARAGFAIAGLLHILIGILAISVATGGGQEADQSGALSTIGKNPVGALLLWVVVVALFAVGIWQILEAATVQESDPKKRTAKRLKEAGIAVAYIAIGVTAVRYALGSGSSSAQSTQKATAGLLGSPFGVALVLIVAVAAIAIGVSFVWSGAKEKFLKTMTPPSGTAGKVTKRLGQVGYIAKGIAVVVIGILFAVAAFTADPNRAGGLDGALKTLAALPFGVAILILVGLGFIAYGLFFFVRAWRPRL